MCALETSRNRRSWPTGRGGGGSVAPKMIKSGHSHDRLNVLVNNFICACSFALFQISQIQFAVKVYRVMELLWQIQ